MCRVICSILSINMRKHFIVTYKSFFGSNCIPFMFCWLILPCFLLFLVMEILHADEDTSAVFVWDGTDAPPASILAKWVLTSKEKSFQSSDYLFWAESFIQAWLYAFHILRLLFFYLVYNVWLSTGEVKKTRHLAVSLFILYCQEMYCSAFQPLERSWEFI